MPRRGLAERVGPLGPTKPHCMGDRVQLQENSQDLAEKKCTVSEGATRMDSGARVEGVCGSQFPGDNMYVGRSQYIDSEALARAAAHVME